MENKLSNKCADLDIDLDIEFEKLYYIVLENLLKQNTNIQKFLSALSQQRFLFSRSQCFISNFSSVVTAYFC